MYEFVLSYYIYLIGWEFWGFYCWSGGKGNLMGRMEVTSVWKKAHKSALEGAPNLYKNMEDGWSKDESENLDWISKMIVWIFGILRRLNIHWVRPNVQWWALSAVWIRSNSKVFVKSANTTSNIRWSHLSNVRSCVRWWVLCYYIQKFWSLHSFGVDNKKFLLPFDEMIQPLQLSALSFNLEWP